LQISPTTRLLRKAYWLIPFLFCLVLYWPGLWVWFTQDDFMWLGLVSRIHTGSSLWQVLFEPTQQGTLRPLSEHAFFLAFHELFGLDAFPYRLCAFLTQMANLALVAAVTWKLTRSEHAAFWAPVFWTANSALAMAMTWTSSYNQILCSFFLLAAFLAFLRSTETGSRRWEVLQWAAFLLGFGALETNLVYPVFPLLYAACRARRYLLRTLPLFLPSVAFIFLHLSIAPRAASGPYAMHFDLSIFRTLWRYWQWAFGAMPFPELVSSAALGQLTTAGILLFTIALLGFAGWKLHQRDCLPGALLAWFLALLAPVLPLRDHFSDYYLMLPVMPLAMLGAWAFASAWRARRLWKTAAILLAALYLATSGYTTWCSVTWRYQRSREVRTMVLGVVRAHELHPDKTILLDGVTSDQFWGALRDWPFRSLGIREVYLTPDSDSRIKKHPELARVSEFVMPRETTLSALENGTALVYTVGKRGLRNVTPVYRAKARALWATGLPRRVDVGNPLFAGQLGDGWQNLEAGYRWSKKRATLRLGGAVSADQKLYISGYSPETPLRKGVVTMTVTVAGTRLKPARIDKPGIHFEYAFPLPPAAVGAKAVEVQIEVSPTIVEPVGGRELGLVIDRVEIR